MTLEEATKILESHNVWRRSNDDFPTMENPTLLGIAIDMILADMRDNKFTKRDIDIAYSTGVSDGMNENIYEDFNI